MATLGVISHKTKKIGPYCRSLQRGAMSDMFDGRSREGRFLRKIEMELTAQLGGEPSFSQKLLVIRTAKMILRLDLLEHKLDEGKFTNFDTKVFSSLNNAVRLALRDLGLRGKPTSRAPNIAQYMEAIAKSKEAKPDASP